MRCFSSKVLNSKSPVDSIAISFLFVLFSFLCAYFYFYSFLSYVRMSGSEKSVLESVTILFPMRLFPFSILFFSLGLVFPFFNSFCLTSNTNFASFFTRADFFFFRLSSASRSVPIYGLVGLILYFYSFFHPNIPINICLRV